jgi:integrase
VRLPFRHTGNPYFIGKFARIKAFDLTLRHFLRHCSGMKAIEIASNRQPSLNRRVSHSRYKYKKVLDGRKQPIRGLWERNGKFVARISTEDDDGMKRIRWVVMEEAETVAQAQEELKTLHVDRKRNELPILKRTPKFADYAAQYLAYFNSVKDAKRPATIQKERGAIRLWTEHMGGLRLDKIRRIHINSFIEKRQTDGMSGRTVNLDIITLRNVLKRAIEDQWLKVLPTENLRPLKWTPRKRSLVSQTDIDSLCKAALKVSKNGREFADYVLLMAYSGTRRNEALRIKWSDVDWKNEQLTIGADGLNKGREIRVVDFNQKLKEHLQQMFKRQAPDSQFLFPSPQRGDKDVSTKTFMESLRLARKESKLLFFNFHDCRHFFISYCVMSGIDYMTIARWVGHKDGGILIGKVYGHLNNEHTQAQAARLNFGPAIAA